MGKKQYNKPFMIKEGFHPSLYICNCTCTVTFRGTMHNTVYYDSNDDGYYQSGENYTNIGNSRTVTIDLTLNKELGYVYIAKADNANHGINTGDLRMSSLNNQTYDFYTAKSSKNKYSTSNWVCGVLGTDGKMYLSESPGFTSISNKTAS